MPNYDATINGCPVTVYASVTGKYYPATLLEPEELPEAEVLEIEYEGKALPQHFFVLLEEELTRIQCAIEAGDIQPHGADDVWD